MSKMKFLGARISEDIFKLVDDTAREEKTDRSFAIRELILLGRQKLTEERALELYRNGKISSDKAADIAGVTVAEMMFLISKAGIKSEETFKEYKKGLKLLIN